MSKAKPPTTDPDGDMDDYQSKDDARTLTRAQEIQNDPDRHAKASKHLEKNAGNAADAHKAARKQLEKHVKGKMKKAFPGDKQGGTFQSEQDKEMAEKQATVHEKE